MKKGWAGGYWGRGGEGVNLKLKSQIEIVEQRLAIWRKQKGKNIINSESGKWILQQ